ncbi:MAG: FtsX-like permease family protein, partial [Gemmatimonadaceae bacterium]
ADAKYTELRGATPATVYLPALQQVDGNANFAIRVAAASQNAGALSSSIRSAVREIDPALPVLNLRTQDEQIDRLHGQELLFAKLSGLFGVLALLLAGVGVYGLMSHAVLRRTAEIGLRVALGALPGHVIAMMLRECLLLVALGIAIGAAAAFSLGRVIASMPFDVSPADPLTYGAVCIILTAIALLASMSPARRASHIDPVVALKIE